MMHRFVALLLVVAIGPFTLAQSTAPVGGRTQQANIEQTLRSLSDQWAKVPVTRDASVLRRIWATDFVYVEASGRIFNKEEGMLIFSKMTDKYTPAKSATLRCVFTEQALLPLLLATIVKLAVTKTEDRLIVSPDLRMCGSCKMDLGSV